MNRNGAYRLGMFHRKAAQMVEHPTGYWKALASSPSPKSMNFLDESFVFIKISFYASIKLIILKQF